MSRHNVTSLACQRALVIVTSYRFSPPRTAHVEAAESWARPMSTRSRVKRYLRNAAEPSTTRRASFSRSRGPTMTVVRVSAAPAGRRSCAGVALAPDHRVVLKAEEQRIEPLDAAVESLDVGAGDLQVWDPQRGIEGAE